MKLSWKKVCIINIAEPFAIETKHWATSNYEIFYFPEWLES